MNVASIHARLTGPLTAPALLSCLAFLATIAAVLDLVLHGIAQPAAAAAFGATIALGEAIRIALPHGRDSAPLASTAAFGFAFCYSIAAVRTTYGTAEVVAVVALATVAGVSFQAYAGRQARPGYLARRILVAGFTALIFRGWLLHGPLAGGQLGQREPLGLCAVMAAVATAGGALDHVLASLATPQELPRRASGIGPILSARRLLTGFRDDCVATAWVCPTIILFAVAVALTADPLGLWVLPIAAAPILVVQRSLRRYAEISATYQQTIRALSRVTELADYTEPGHARRVCHLALAIGRDLSLSESLLLDLEYAALLHDIGQLSLTDPIPGGATVLIAPDRAASVAALGADVVRQTGVLDRVADILEHQARPFRPDQADDPVALAGAIIRAANAYDDLVSGALDLDRRLAAVRRIRLGMAAEYDPRVVESLTRMRRVRRALSRLTAADVSQLAAADTPMPRTLRRPPTRQHLHDHPPRTHARNNAADPTQAWPHTPHAPLHQPARHTAAVLRPLTHRDTPSSSAYASSESPGRGAQSRSGTRTNPSRAYNRCASVISSSVLSTTRGHPAALASAILARTSASPTPRPRAESRTPSIRISASSSTPMSRHGDPAAACTATPSGSPASPSSSPSSNATSCVVPGASQRERASRSTSKYSAPTSPS